MKNIFGLLVYIVIFGLGIYAIAYFASMLFLIGVSLRGREDIFISTLMYISIPVICISYIALPIVLTLLAVKLKWSKYINCSFSNILYPSIALILLLLLESAVNIEAKQRYYAILSLCAFLYLLIYIDLKINSCGEHLNKIKNILTKLWAPVVKQDCISNTIALSRTALFEINLIMAIYYIFCAFNYLSLIIIIAGFFPIIICNLLIHKVSKTKSKFIKILYAIFSLILIIILIIYEFYSCKLSEFLNK